MLKTHEKLEIKRLDFAILDFLNAYGRCPYFQLLKLLKKHCQCDAPKKLDRKVAKNIDYLIYGKLIAIDMESNFPYRPLYRLTAKGRSILLTGKAPNT